jgi:thiamine-phosphate pyrophosphorylase
MIPRKAAGLREPKMIALPRLYAVADQTFGDPVQIATALFEGGAQLVQIRDKAATAQTLLREVEEVLKAAPPGVRLIVNDRSDVARISGAAGVHLGQHDLAPTLARSTLVSGQIVGRSTHNLSQAMEADRDAVDYIAVGPIFSTSTKLNPDPVVGLDSLREICYKVRKPVVAIGGITLETAHDVLACGATSVAVIGDVLKHGNVANRTRVWMNHLEP